MLLINKKVDLSEHYPKILKKVNDNYIFDYDSIIDKFNIFNVYFLLAERGSKGKTTGAKIRGLDDFLDNGRPTLFLRNTTEQIAFEISRFIDGNLCKVDERFNDIKCKGNKFYLNNKLVFEINSLNNVGKIKGSRIMYNHIVYDEINEAHNAVQPNLMVNLDSLLASTVDQIGGGGYETKFWVLANLKSLNHPLFYNWGVYSIQSKINAYYSKYNNEVLPNFCIFTSMFSDDEKDIFIKDNIKKDWRLRLSLLSNNAAHTYFNETIENEINNILKLKKSDYEIYFTIKFKSMFLNVYKMKNSKNLYVKIGKKNNSDDIFIIRYKEVSEGHYFLSSLQTRLATKLMNNEIYFDKMISRAVFLQAISY